MRYAGGCNESEEGAMGKEESGGSGASPAAETPAENGGRRGAAYWEQRVKEAVRYWEPRRLIYNAVLTAMAVIWVVGTWPHFRGAVTLEHALALVVLALLANLCYCAAYLVEIPLAASTMRAVWARKRWVLLLLGMVVALVLENYWIADEIYPDVK
jgi:hypothetical protein